MRILGIETSCDETAASVIDVDENRHITLLSHIITSSLNLHKKTGGIIPEIAAREQIKYILPVIEEALKKGLSVKKALNSIDTIAVTVGPGLIGSLLVGVETAKTLSLVWNKPIIPVNHLYGHIYANFISENPKSEIRNPKLDPEFPALALIVSGGHTDLVLMKNHKQLQWLSGTRDDAAGEAFDKIGRLLGLPYPAGPIIEKLAAKGNPRAFHFPRPLLHEDTLDFSFSGLKTAVLREVQRLEKSSNISHFVADLCRATQDAIIDVLVKKTLKAAEQFQVKSLLLGGGVAANQTLVETFKAHCSEIQVHFFSPKKTLCTDNAAMIAAAAVFHSQEQPWQEITANPELHFA